MPHTAITDKELVAQAVRGRTDAFGQLVERHIHGAYAIAYARVGNAVDAEDAVQEAFLRALEKLRSLRDPAKFGSWLLSIARNEAVRLSTERERTAGDTFDNVAAIAPDAGSQEMNALVREQVMRLPEQHREILLLHYFTGRNTKEIAELLDIRQGAVLKRLQRAREQLAETILRDLEGTRPPEASFTKQVARITALASALALPQAVSSASVATAGTLAGGLKWGLGVAALIGFVAIFGLAARTNGKRPESVPGASLPVVQAAAISNTEQPSAITNDTRLASALENDATPQSNAPESTAASGEADNATNQLPENLTGSWYFNIVQLAPSSTFDNKFFEFHNKDLRFKDNGITLGILHDDAGPIVTKGEGKIAGNHLFMDFAETHAGSQKVAHLEGQYQPNATQMSLTGWIRWDTLPQEGAPDGHRGEQWAATLVWTRKSEVQVSEGKYVGARVEEMNALYKAMVAYAKEHQHKTPDRIEDLVPRYLPSVSQFTPAAGVTSFTYTPLEYLISGDEVRDILHEAIRPIDGDPDRERQQRIDLEKLLGRFARPDNSGRPRTIAEASYDQFDLDLVLNAFGDWRRHGRHCNETIDDHATSDELVIACGKHMENATSAVMNFTNAWTRGAQGWLTLLAWIEDECMLYCPGRENQIIAREILFPNATNEELVAT